MEADVPLDQRSPPRHRIHLAGCQPPTWGGRIEPVTFFWYGKDGRLVNFHQIYHNYMMIIIIMVNHLLLYILANKPYIYIYIFWLVVKQQVWKIWVRQLGWWLFPIYGKKCSKPPTSFLHFREYLNSEFTHEQLVSLGFNRIGIMI